MNLQATDRRPVAPPRATVIEPLEARRLLAASVIDRVLYVDGTDAAEQITVRGAGTLGSLSFDVTVGAEQTSIPATADLQGIVVRAGAGDDSVTVELTIMIDLPLPRPGEALPSIGPQITVEGGDGSDVVDAGTSAAAVLIGGAGDDRLTGGGSKDVLRGGAGNDHLVGGAGRDNLWGGAGGDTLEGGEGRDRIRGGAGRDGFVRADARSERLDFGRGDGLSVQRLVLGERARIQNGILVVTGTDDADAITVRQEQEPPPADGSSPATQVFYVYSIRQGDHPIDSGRVSIADARGIRIEAGGGDDVVDATQAPGPGISRGVTVLGGHGNDRILGSGGSDVLNGGAGDDQIDGGFGDDHLGSVYLGPREHDEPQPGVEFPDEPGNDVITGGAGADVVDAGAGADRVSGGDGTDRLYGGPDADEVRGEGGLDTFYTLDAPAEHLDRAGDEPADDAFDITPPSTRFPFALVQDGVLIIRGTEAGESITVGQEVVPGSAPGDPASVVRFFYSGFIGDIGFTDSVPSDGSITAVRIEAGGGDDVLDLNGGHAPTPGREFTGVTLPVEVFGGDGNDRITGGAGDDRLNGGDGDDEIDGGGGNDLVGRSIEPPSFPPGTVGGTAQYEERGHDILRGGAGDDSLDGGEGHDRLFGGEGADKLSGNAGNDEIRGEGGRDTFFAADAPAELLDRENDEPVSADAL